MKKIRITSLLLVLCLLIPMLSFNAYAASNVVIYPAPESLPTQYRSGDFSILVNNQSVPVYASGKNAWGNTVSYASFDFSGSISVKVSMNFSFSSYKLIPNSLGISGQRQNNTITFNLDQPENVTVLLDGNYQGRVLHLFAQAPEIDQPSQADSNVIYYAPGYYDLSNQAPIKLNAGQTLYIAGGAVVRGRFLIQDTSQVVVRGKGILMNDYSSNDGYDNVPLVLKRSSNVSIRDLIITRDIGAWNAFMWRCGFVDVSNLKVIGTKYASSDGFDIANSHDVTFDHVFIRSCDDSVAIKGTGNSGYNSADNPALSDPDYNITYQNAQLWSDANNAIGLGAETVAGYYDNIKFSNIDILYNYDDLNYPNQLTDRSAINICALNATNISNVTFENIRLEKGKRLIGIDMADDFWFGSLKGNWSWPGSISNIQYRNIESYSDGSNEIRIYGRDDNHIVSNVTLENIKINGGYLSDFNNSNMHINSYAKGINILNPGMSSPAQTDGPVGVISHSASKEYSAVQGTNGWNYRTWAAGIGVFNMAWNRDGSNHWRGPNTYDAIWNGVNCVYMHPDNDQAMLEWTSSYTGNIMITGDVKKLDTAGGDGVNVSIWKNNTMIWPSDGSWKTVEFNDSIGINHNIQTSVLTGDIISFRVDQRGSNAYDSTSWSPVITCS